VLDDDVNVNNDRDDNDTDNNDHDDNDVRNTILFLDRLR